MAEQVEYFKVQDNKPKKSEVPLTLKWKNAPMVRIHSVRSAVREILNLSKALDVVKINIIGPPSTGKTELAKVIQHLSHSLADIPYTVRTFTRDDLLNFEETLATLQPTNHVLLFDDISFISATAGKKQVERIQKAFTEIRHLPGGQDIKVIAIFNFHYNMAVSKYLRQSDFFCYTSIGSSELENTLNVVGKKYQQKLLDFRRVTQQAFTTSKYTFMLGKKGQKFTYDFRKPFAPLLFWNNDTARIVVFPSRDWIEPFCKECLNSVQHTVQESMNLQKFDDDMKSEFGVGVIRQALRIKLFNMGVETFPKRVKQCMKKIDDYTKSGPFNAEEVADHYNLKMTNTHYYPPRKKI